MQPTNFTIVQGTPFRFLVKVRTKNDAGESIPVLLPPETVIQLQARFNVTDVATVLDLSTKTGEIELTGDAGNFVVTMSSDQTSNLKWRRPRARYQCEVHLPDGEDIRVLEGILSLDPEVVR